VIIHSSNIHNLIAPENRVSDGEDALVTAGETPALQNAALFGKL